MRLGVRTLVKPDSEERVTLLAWVKEPCEWRKEAKVIVDREPKHKLDNCPERGIPRWALRQALEFHRDAELKYEDHLRDREERNRRHLARQLHGGLSFDQRKD